MGDSPTAAALIGIFLFAAFGWGRLAAGFFYLIPTRSMAYEAALGLSLWVFAGGILNIAGIAKPVALDGILISGAILAVFFVFREVFAKKGKDSPGITDRPQRRYLLDGIPVILVVAVSVFYAFHLLPTSALNHHDDFYKYMPRIFRMLQTGTVGGTPFDFIGLDSLGGQAFLQGFFMAHLPAQYVNAFDAVTCFLLGGLLLNGLGREIGINWYYRTLAVSAYIIINPQYVNISALYSGTLMILALIYSCLLLPSSTKQIKLREMLPAVIPMALFTSTLIGLKQTFPPFALSYCFMFFLLFFLRERNTKRFLGIISMFGFSAGIMLAPWLLAVSDKIIMFFGKLIRRVAPESMPHGYSEISTSFINNLLSSGKLYYGGTALLYSFMVFGLVIAAIWSCYLFARKENKENDMIYIVMISAGLATFLGYMVNAYLARMVEVGIRYSCPLLIGVFPAAMMLVSRNIVGRVPTNGFGGMKKVTGAAILIIMSVAAAGMFKVTADRFAKLRSTGSMLSFPFNEAYLTYNKYVLSEPQRELVRTMQMRTEPGTTIMAWFDTPFLLDFSRNRIFTFGLASQIYTREERKDRIEGGAPWLAEYLKNYGIDYVLWSYKGPAKVDYAEANSSFNKTLGQLVRRSRIIYDDGTRVIFGIGQE